MKYTEAILSNSTRKLLWFEITKMLIAVKIILLCYSFRHTFVPYYVRLRLFLSAASRLLLHFRRNITEQLPVRKSLSYGRRGCNVFSIRRSRGANSWNRNRRREWGWSCSGIPRCYGHRTLRGSLSGQLRLTGVKSIRTLDPRLRLTACVNISLCYGQEFSVLCFLTHSVWYNIHEVTIFNLFYIHSFIYLSQATWPIQTHTRTHTDYTIDTNTNLFNTFTVAQNTQSASQTTVL